MRAAARRRAWRPRARSCRTSRTVLPRGAQRCAGGSVRGCAGAWRCRGKPWRPPCCRCGRERKDAPPPACPARGPGQAGHEPGAGRQDVRKSTAPRPSPDAPPPRPLPARLSLSAANRHGRGVHCGPGARRGDGAGRGGRRGCGAIADGVRNVGTAGSVAAPENRPRDPAGRGASGGLKKAHRVL